MKKALFVTFNSLDHTHTGGSQCSSRNYNALSKSLETDFYVVESVKFNKFLSLFFLLFPPFTISNRKELNKKIKSNTYELIFFDSSLFGIYVKYIREKFKIKTISFFHNVEYDYISVRFGKKIIKYPYLFLAWINEKLSIKYSTATIILSNRDKNRISELYGEALHHIIPITFEDVVHQSIQHTNTDDTPAILFVGSCIRSNYEATKWFVEKVMPYIKNANLWIVGKNFESKKEELTRTNVKVIGTVKNLGEYYLESSCVVSPIFHGAGMKVKIAEALMYGRTIFGTNEAFEGYEIHDDTVTILCNNSTEFIEKINNFILNPKISKYNENSRKLYENFYSSKKAENLITEILEHINLKCL